MYTFNDQRAHDALLEWLGERPNGVSSRFVLAKGKGWRRQIHLYESRQFGNTEYCAAVSELEQVYTRAEAPAEVLRGQVEMLTEMLDQFAREHFLPVGGAT